MRFRESPNTLKFYGEFGVYIPGEVPLIILASQRGTKENPLKVKNKWSK